MFIEAVPVSGLEHNSIKAVFYRYTVMVMPSDLGTEEMWSVAEKLGSILSIEEIDVAGRGLRIEFQDESIFFSTLNAGHVSDEGSVDMESINRVLALIDDVAVEFTATGAYAYEARLEDFSGDEGAVDKLADIVQGQAERESVQLDELQEWVKTGGFHAWYTPPQVAEILSGWVVTETTESVLDIATGSGTLLHEAADQLSEPIESSVQLVGVDSDPLACSIARTRLKDQKGAKIVQTDFLEWNRSGEDTDFEPQGQMFDAIVGNPPMVRPRHLPKEQRDWVRNWYRGQGRSASAVFVAKAVAYLKDGGRAAFVLPKNALRYGLLEHLSETCGIHRIVELPVNAFSDGGPSLELVVLTVVKENRSPEVRETGVARFNRMELPENARGLFEQELDAILENRYNRYDAEIVKVAHADLEEQTIMRLLSTPSIYNVLTADGFDRLEDFAPAIETGSGVTSGNNEFFYFDEDEKKVSGIDDRFFRPLIKELPDDTLQITSEHIDQYVFDLQPYLEELDEGGIALSESEILEQLQLDGYDGVVEYIESVDPSHTAAGHRFLLDRRGKFQNPNLVMHTIFTEPRCYSVEIEDAMFDTNIIGFRTESDELRTALRRLLNTPIYKEFLKTFASSMKVQWYRINHTQLRKVPIIEQALSQEVARKLDAFLPPKDDNDVVGLNQAVIEVCETDEEKQALQRYMASKDDFAWSWFLTLPEVEQFQELLDEDRTAAREFVMERFDEELLDGARKTFNTLEFFEHRRELLNDLLMEFEEGHYRGFLAGITLQFEGVLTDLVDEAGGEIIEENGKTEFRLPGQDNQETKSLNKLISTFFDGTFSTFLDETVRKRRNRIAHGDVIENDRELAVHFFIAFYALCYATLAEYTRFANAQHG